MFSDLTDTRARLRAGTTSASAEIERCIDAAQAPSNRHSFVRTSLDTARTTSVQFTLSTGRSPGWPYQSRICLTLRANPPLRALIVLADAPAALADSGAVARLRAHGCCHHWAHQHGGIRFFRRGCELPFRHTRRMGCAVRCPARRTPRPWRIFIRRRVSVATGAAFSTRPGSTFAGLSASRQRLNGIVGFKNTARLVPTTGTVPLSTTLDTACAMTRTVRDAILAHQILANRRVTRSLAPLSQYRLAIPSTVFLEDMDATVARAFERSVSRPRRRIQ